MITQLTEKKTVTRQTFADRHEVSLRTVDYWIQDRIIPAIRLSRRCVRIPVQEADAALMKFATGGEKTRKDDKPRRLGEIIDGFSKELGE